MKQLHQQFAEADNNKSSSIFGLLTAIAFVFTGYGYYLVNYVDKYPYLTAINCLVHIVLCLLCAYIVNAGYTQRRDQIIVFRIRQQYICDEVCENVFSNVKNTSLPSDVHAHSHKSPKATYESGKPVTAPRGKEFWGMETFHHDPSSERMLNDRQSVSQSVRNDGGNKQSRDSSSYNPFGKKISSFLPNHYLILFIGCGLIELLFAGHTCTLSIKSHISPIYSFFILIFAVVFLFFLIFHFYNKYKKFSGCESGLLLCPTSGSLLAASIIVLLIAISIFVITVTTILIAAGPSH